MNEVILCIGCNVNVHENMQWCKDLLQQKFSDIYYSDMIETEPYGNTNYVSNFLNQLAFFKTDLLESELQIRLKAIEIRMGRNEIDKQQGVVVIDVDLIKWNEDVLKPNDWHRAYVRDLLPSLYLYRFIAK